MISIRPSQPPWTAYVALLTSNQQPNMSVLTFPSDFCAGRIQKRAVIYLLINTAKDISCFNVSKVPGRATPSHEHQKPSVWRHWLLSPGQRFLQKTALDSPDVETLVLFLSVALWGKGNRFFWLKACRSHSFWALGLRVGELCRDHGSLWQRGLQSEGPLPLTDQREINGSSFRSEASTDCAPPPRFLCRLSPQLFTAQK